MYNFSYIYSPNMFKIFYIIWLFNDLLVFACLIFLRDSLIRLFNVILQHLTHLSIICIVKY